MRLIFRTSMFMLACAGSAMMAVGQEDPFAPGGNAKPAADTKPARAADPVAQLPKATHPVVAAIREAGPKTPLEWVLAARAVAQVEVYDEARRYLKMVLDAQLDEPTRYELVRRFGTAYFLQLRLNEKLQPEGTQLADAVMAAVRQRWSDPASVGRLLEEAARASGRTLLSRVSELRAGGDLPVVLLVQWLADQQRRPAARKLIATWNPTAEEPLGRALMAYWSLRLDDIDLLPETRIGRVTPLLLSMAVRESADPAQREAARATLQRLLHRIPTRQEVRDHLWAAVQQHLAEARSVRRNDPTARTTVWAWETDLSAVKPRDVWRDEYEVLQAGRAAVALAHVDPTDRLARQLLHLMEFQLHYGGEDSEHGIAISSIEIQESDETLQESEDLDNLLSLALRGELPGAAMHVCDKMALVGHRASLVGAGGQPSLLVNTMQHPNRNIRYAATMAVAKLAVGSDAFPGAGMLTDSLRFFMTSHGESRVLIGAARVDIATEFSAAASILGFTSDYARSGRELAKKIHQDADFGAVLIDSAITDPPLKEAVQLVRKSPRGHEAVILVMAKSDNLKELTEAFRDDPRIVVRISLPDPDALAEDMRRLLAQAGRWRTLPNERLAQAKQALLLATDLLEDQSSRLFVDANRFEAAAAQSLFSSELSVAAARLLSLIGTDRAQRALAEFALRRGENERARKAATVALSEHIGRFGRLLRQTDLDRLMDITRDRRDEPITAVVLSLLRPSPVQPAVTSDDPDAG